MNLAHIQYLDFRDGAYAHGLRALIGELCKFDAAIPKHFIYRSFYKRFAHVARMHCPDPKYSSRKCWHSAGSWMFAKEPVHGAMAIRLEDLSEALRARDSLDTLFVRPNAFKTAAHLLDEIYINYLADRYPPFSYGREWHLRRSAMGPTQLGVDWRLLHDRLDSERSPITLMNGSPETYWFVADSEWEIADGMPLATTVLAGYDKWLLETILTEMKAAFLIRCCMEEVDAAKFDRTKLKFVAVATHLWGNFANKLFVQTKDVSPDEKERWTY
jgi:hypothetical protein